MLRSGLLVGPLLCLLILSTCALCQQTQRQREQQPSRLETPDILERVQLLAQDNLEPALNVWRQMAQQHGRKLTMRDFFRTVQRMRREQTASFWGIKNNKLFRPWTDGPARYDPIIMAQEHRPNKDSAEWSLRSMWLALEEAMEAGMQFPDVLFLYNGGDQPMCNKYYPCHDYLHVPPISVIGYNESLLPPDGRAASMEGFRPATGLGDLVTPLFRFTGHSMAPSLHPHHPTIVKLHSRGDPLWSSKRIITRNPVPWPDKIPKLFFRGKAWCSYMKRYGCPRIRLSNMTLDHWEELDISSEGARLGRRVFRPKGYKPFYPMADWSKFKYLAALDGIGASSRTMVLYHLGSVVLKQRRTAYVEWFYQSLKTGVHQEELWNTDTDTLDVVRKLRANDDYARGLADASTAFARKYLVKEVMMVYTKLLLQKYRDLFEDMEEYMQVIGDPGNSSFFQAHLRGWSRDWRSVQPSPDFVPNLPKTGIFGPPRVRGLQGGPGLRGMGVGGGHIQAGS